MASVRTSKEIQYGGRVGNEERSMRARPIDINRPMPVLCLEEDENDSSIDKKLRALEKDLKKAKIQSEREEEEEEVDVNIIEGGGIEEKFEQKREEVIPTPGVRIIEEAEDTTLSMLSLWEQPSELQIFKGSSLDSLSLSLCGQFFFPSIFVARFFPLFYLYPPPNH